LLSKRAIKSIED